jgi:hypothetical protein
MFTWTKIIRNNINFPFKILLKILKLPWHYTGKILNISIIIICGNDSWEMMSFPMTGESSLLLQKEGEWAENRVYSLWGEQRSGQEPGLFSWHELFLGENSLDTFDGTQLWKILKTKQNGWNLIWWALENLHMQNQKRRKLRGVLTLQRRILGLGEWKVCYLKSHSKLKRVG